MSTTEPLLTYSIGETVTTSSTSHAVGSATAPTTPPGSHAPWGSTSGGRVARRQSSDLREGLALISYARISADTERDGHGVREQHADHREIAASASCVIAREYTDNYKSASKGSTRRDEFEEMVDALQAGHLRDGTSVDGAIIERFDRASRTFGDWERFHDALTSKPGRVLVIDGQAKDPYSEGFLWESAAAMVGAKSEPRKMSARQVASHRRRAMEGRPVGGNRPFGWLPDRVTLDPVESELLREAVTRYVGGATVGSLVRWLNGSGMTTTRGNPWTTAALKVTLRNPRNCGLRLLDGEPVKDRDGRDVTGLWAPIVGVDDWRAVCERMDTGRGAPVRRESTYLLVGLLRCGRGDPMCLASMRVVHHRDVHGHTYQCPSPYNGGCAGSARNGPRLDAYITERVLTRLDARQWGTRPAGGWDGAEDYRSAVERRSALATAWGEKRVSNELFFSQVEPLELEIRRLDAARRRHDAALARSRTLPTDIRAQWASADMEWRRAILGTVIRSVVVYPVGRGRRRYAPAETLNVVWVD